MLSRSIETPYSTRKNFFATANDAGSGKTQSVWRHLGRSHPQGQNIFPSAATSERAFRNLVLGSQNVPGQNRHCEFLVRRKTAGVPDLWSADNGGKLVRLA